MGESGKRTRFTGPRGYLVPGPARHRSEEIIRKSRFVTSLGRAVDPGVARAFIDAARAELPTATHHCWAYRAGPPGDTALIGLSDAGEPHGTAGRPILNVLSKSGVGEIVAVVTRYFGGVKLGRGGLARAYSGTVARALGTLETSTCIPSCSVEIRVSFAAADAIFRFLREIGATRGGERYAADLTIEAQIPLPELDRLVVAVAEVTSGSGDVRVLDRLP